MYALRLASRRIPCRFLFPITSKIELKQERYASTSMWTEFVESMSFEAVVSIPADRLDDLVEIHNYTGLPWWATIILNTIIVRSIISLPLAVYREKQLSRKEHKILAIDTETSDLMESLKSDVEPSNRIHQKAMEAYLHIRRYMALHLKINPYNTFNPMFFMLDSVALWNLTEFESLPHLAAMNALWVLPVAYGVLNLLIVESYAAVGRNVTLFPLFGMKDPNQVNVLIKMLIATVIPPTVCFYWVSWSAIGFALNLMLFSPKVRRILRISGPEMPKHPYRRIADRLLRRSRGKDPS